jgi:hypothetical protein
MIERETAVQTPRPRLAQGGLGLALGLMLAACGSSGTDGKPNAAPIANAGAAQNAKVDFAVTVDGSASSDPEGAALAYYWGITAQPPNSKAKLSGANTAKATFTPDVAGEYTLRLMVSDGVNVSAPAYVKVTAVLGNYPPVADAGTAKTAGVGALVTLDGSASHDRNNDPLTFAWTLTGKPADSQATLDAATATSVSATFTPDVVGTYVASLVVSDGQETSAPATVTITVRAGNLAPIADPTLSPTTGVVGRVVKLNGGKSSDGNNDPLTYAWTLTGKPAESKATLDAATATSVSATFTPDVVGTYVASLVVNDGKVGSTDAAVTIAVVANERPVAKAGPAQNVIPGTLATLDGTGSSDANGDAVTYAWTTISSPPASAAALAGADTAHPSFIPDIAGSVAASWQFQLVVSDGLLDSTSTTVTITTTGFTPTQDFFAPYLDPADATSFLATTAPVVKAPIRFFSTGKANLKMYQASSGATGVLYNGDSFKTSAANLFADGGTVDLTLKTSLTRFVSMPYSRVAVPVTAAVTYAYVPPNPNTCKTAQLLLVDAAGKILKAQNVCGDTTPTTLSVSFTDPTNTEVHVLFSRGSDTNATTGKGFGGFRLFGMTLTKTP